MSEELRKNKALDDAAMESVSGGIDPETAESLASNICGHCQMYLIRHCNAGTEKLAAYMVEHDVRIHGQSQCPFYCKRER